MCLLPKRKGNLKSKLRTPNAYPKVCQFSNKISLEIHAYDRILFPYKHFFQNRIYLIQYLMIYEHFNING